MQAFNLFGLVHIYITTTKDAYQWLLPNRKGTKKALVVEILRIGVAYDLLCCLAAQLACEIRCLNFNVQRSVAT